MRDGQRSQMQIQEEDDDSMFDAAMGMDAHGDMDYPGGMGKRRIKKKKKQPPQQYKNPTDRDLLMAKAYGGVARG